MLAAAHSLGQNHAGQACVEAVRSVCLGLGKLGRILAKVPLIAEVCSYSPPRGQRSARIARASICPRFAHGHSLCFGSARRFWVGAPWGLRRARITSALKFKIRDRSLFAHELV